ncbi:MAG: helix-turn-helix domain-containing protein [Ottowia sp.]|nr:Fis family transcriptional regulator [Ottowia sp.]
MSTKKNNGAVDHCIRERLELYFRDLRGVEPSGMHAMLIQAVERPLLEMVMERAEGNQSRAASWLGMNRNTLRKKLIDHGLLPRP